MSKKNKTTPLVVVIVLLIIMTLLSSGCFDASINEIIKSVESPDGAFIAYLFIRDLGATTRESYQLSILRKGKKLGSKAGNVFIAYGEYDIEWTGEKELTIKNITIEQVFLDEEKYIGVTIKHYPPKSTQE